MKNPTIQKLRQAGFKVRVHHKRPTFQVKGKKGVYEEFVSTGGKTRIEVTTPDGKTTAVGETICSNEDQYVRKTGNSIALGRAIARLLQEAPETLQQFN
jgi:hypothetical protein